MSRHQSHLKDRFKGELKHWMLLTDKPEQDLPLGDQCENMSKFEVLTRWPFFFRYGCTSEFL